jgi:DNA/RNA endonuclease YhcR with UshA esterase domain
MRRRANVPLLTAFVLTGSAVFLWPLIAGAETITASEAKNHIGETATVCGKVASTKYAASSRGRPTFLNLDRPYPDQIFTVLIWGSDRPKFGQPEETYRGKDICVTGKIKEYRGVPEIIAYEPEQIALQKNKPK